MKQSMIEKTLESGEITESQLALINRFTRRNLGREEIFAFSLILCDNEIDRDGERFPRASLDVLAGLFVGKTGIFDHNPKAGNQSARIFEAKVEETAESNSLGEPCCRLRAWAYMLRTPKNEELILEIDGGIKKEVSIGCAVERVVCSVCGAEQKTKPCTHQKGERYGSAVCHHLLENPTDAYEWSFVAVPAQKSAGVTKLHRVGGSSGESIASLTKLFDHSGEVTLSAGELTVLKAQYCALQNQAAAGEEYLARLRGEIVKLAGIAQPELSPGLVEVLAARLDREQLLELQGSLTKAARRVFPFSPQLAPARREEERQNPYSI